jgi:enamine deaminase RidA (YjgF/YER057c/UK114 family)
MIQHLNPQTLSHAMGYSHVTVVAGGRHAHISGQVALDARGAIVGVGDLAAQTQQVYDNLAAALDAVGVDFTRVFKVVTYVVDLTPEKANIVRGVRMEYLEDGPYPASTTVGVTSLVLPDFLIEIEVIAALD